MSATPPNRLRSPVVVQSLRYGLDPEGYFASAQQRYGDIFSVRLLGERWVVLGHPSAVKEAFALGSQEANSGEANLALRPLIGTGNVLLLDGPEHLARRKLLLPSFHGDRMRAYESTIREASQEAIYSISPGRREPILPVAQALTFSVILRCVFGVTDTKRVGKLGGALREMLGWITDMRRVVMFAALGSERLTGVPSFRRQVTVINREVAEEIAERRLADDFTEREDILSMLIQAQDEDGNGLSDEEIRDELVTLLVAGHETTATTIAWAISELARHPEDQERLAEEMQRDYVEAVIAETLRLRPPVPLVLRKLRSTATIAGHELPAGTTLAPCNLLVHRRADLYPDPWKFQPTRFLERKPVASEWFPFGGATRRCIGAAFARLEAGIAVEELVRAFRFTPDRRRQERLGRRGPILTPGRGAPVVSIGRPPP